MMMLDGPGAEREIKKLLESAKWVRIAVPYWGTGAGSRLGLNSLKPTIDVKIVCNLMSGGCNPKEIKDLENYFGKNVMNCSRLHAKIWLTDSGAVYGSSNASTNGLGVEGTEFSKLLEVNTLTHDNETLKWLRSFFDDEVLPESRDIKPQDYRVARQRYGAMRNTTPIPPGNTIFDVAKSNPETFDGRSIYVWLYEEIDLSKHASKMLDDVKAERKNDKIYAYEDVNLDPDSIIIDFSKKSSGKISFNGAWKILHDSPLIKNADGKKASILLCIKLKNIYGLSLGREKDWIVAAKEASDSGKTDWTLAEFARNFLNTETVSVDRRVQKRKRH